MLAMQTELERLLKPKTARMSSGRFGLVYSATIRSGANNPKNKKVEDLVEKFKFVYEDVIDVDHWSAIQQVLQAHADVYVPNDYCICTLD